MNKVTVTLTKDQANEVWQAIENYKESYLKDYMPNHEAENSRISRRNAFLQRIADKFKQIS
jgi:hypothetical protein